MTERRLSFGTVAELYDAARPSYPEQLVDDVLAYTGDAIQDGALEVGAGTGKATVLFAARGVSVHALEPSAGMAAVAVRRTDRWPQVTVEVSEFERFAPLRHFGLLYAAQSWHWIDPAAGWTKVGEALRSGGALALFWNAIAWERTPVRAELAAVYERLGIAPDPLHPGGGEAVLAMWRARAQDIAAAPGITDHERHSYDWSVDHTAESYRDLLRTHSENIVLERERREALLDGLTAVIERHGGAFTMPLITHLWLARRA